MPWVWVTVGFIVWTAAAFGVIGLCRSARRIDARLGRGGKGVVRMTQQAEARAGAGLEGE
jgi:hypothetical protein